MRTIEPRLLQPPMLAEVGGKSKIEKARATGEQFEAAFLNTMFQQMFTGIGKDGPLGDSTGTGTWRSFLTDEYAKSFAKAGGVGIGDQVYRALLAQQEVRS
jgi:Rod binding domain-containing protein